VTLIVKIARYLKKLEYERALRNKWKIDREREIEQSLEIRRRRGQGQAHKDEASGISK
jgi:hypothetical protein